MGCSVAWNDGADESITVTGRANHGIDIDMNAISDTVPTLAVVALFADGPTTIRNVAHIRDKETDRIGDLACELRRLGATIVEHDDGLTITPGVHVGAHAPGGAAGLHGATVKTYDDHRMAMSLALVGLRVPGVFVADPGCVGKTFPDYWDRLSAITGRSAAIT
jgi:3-phosphoshikimate 1-carboxyvinyltransferase